MCDYCEQSKSLPKILGDENFNGHIDLYLSINKSVLTITNINDFDYDEGECPVSFASVINYCPFCGRKL